MKIIELLRGRRSIGSPSSEAGRMPARSTALEAARRAMKARRHLGKRRRKGRSGARPAPGLELEPTRGFERDFDAVEPSRIEMRPRAGGRPPSRTALPSRPLPRFVMPLATLAAVAAGFAVARPLVAHFWLPRVPLARVGVQGTSARTPDSIAQALLSRAGTPLDRIEAGQIEALVARDPWIEAATSLRLPDGTLLVRVAERRAIARYRRGPEEPVGLLDPTGRPFFGEVASAGALPTVEGPVGEDATLAPAALEILAELARHPDLARHPTILTLRVPEPEAEDAGFVLEIGHSGPRVLLGQSFFTRRIARLAVLLAERDALLATARVIDLRYADRAVLQTEPTSG